MDENWQKIEIWMKQKSLFMNSIKQTKQLPDNSSCMINIDVDPQ